MNFLIIFFYRTLLTQENFTVPMVTEESKRLYFKIFHINPIRANITYKGVPNINEKLYVNFL